MIYEHQVVALQDFQLEEVFSDNKEVHHMVDHGKEGVAKVDIPGNLLPISPSSHRELHGSKGYAGAPVEEILRQNDG